MKNKRKGRIIAISVIVLLVGAILGIIKLSNVDKYAGLVKVKNASLSSISTKLAANISDLTEENEIYTKGYDEIDYTIKYRLSQVPGDRDVIINGKVDENDPYASFKEVIGENITSVLSADRKEITVTIKNLPADEEITSKLTLLIENAPRGYTVSPKVRIKESTSEEYTNIAVKSVTVNTNSLQGLVIDEDGNKVPNILISLKKNEEIIKETYTNSEGIYTFSDITPDTYKVVVNEEIYENLEVSDLYIEEGNVLNLIVKRVYPYKIETNKYITKVELNNLGSSKDYLYDDVELANIPVKRVNNLHGKVYYKIVVQNTGEKEGIISSVKDELPEGLSFDEKLNSGYELKNGIIYNRNLEGKELKAGEQIQDTLVLTIENTDIAKTYINKVNARGELYEHVVYLLNGKQYKTLDVLEGEQLDKLEISNPNFKGWYTDEKLTNLYNYDNPVEKDLILYGVTAKKHKVIFNDKHPETGDITKYDEQDVPNGEPVDKPTPDPSKEGYTFCGWDKDDNTHWDFNTPVTSDLTLTSCYNINEYTVEFYDNSMNDGGDFELISTLTKEYKSVLSNAEAPVVNWEGHNFLKWTTDPEGQHEYDFTKQIKNNIKLYAQYTLQDRLFIFNDENRITEKTVEYGGTVQAIADQGKEGHTFKYWSLTSPSSQEEKTPFDFTTKIYQTTTVYAIYEINVYDVIFNDVDPVTDVPTEYDRQPVPHGSKATTPTPNPEKEGYTFCGWMDGNTAYDFDTPVTGPKTLTSCYEAINLTVRFMDGENLYEQKTVQYGNTVSDTDTHPTKEHNIFKYWSEDNQTGFDFDNTIIKTNKTLYSVYEEIVAPTITHTPLYWTNDRVVVTITSPNPNYTIKYKVDDGSYQTYTEPFELETNSTIVAKSVYGEAESVITSHEVTNIDKLNPVIGTVLTTPTQNSISISAPLTDNESGVFIANIYKDGVLNGSVDGTAINADLKDYTKEKSMSFLLTGLEVNTEYTIKIELIDGAGNKTETTVTETTQPADIICRIISVDGVDLNEEDYIEFPLLASAIADSHCDSKCTIQMLKGTTESVEILETQDITLDLNGKTVSGVLPGYTVSNSGEFTLVDHAQDTNGGLINTNGIAILNNTGSKLTLGEGSSEPPVGSEVRNVSNTVPFVFGETYGVYSENNTELSFFDGKVKGTNAIYGEVTETEYSYNASSNTVGEYEEVSLAQLNDPEARINRSIYYGNVANAVADASQGGTNEMQDTPATFLSGFTHRADGASPEDDNTYTGYKFVYDNETGTLTSTNRVYGSKAFTETVVDLTNETQDKILDINFYATKNSDGSKGLPKFEVYALTENFEESNSSVYKIYGFDQWSWARGDDTNIGYKLEKGKKYKVKVSFTQPIKMEKAKFIEEEHKFDSSYVSPYSLDSKLVLTSATLSNATPEIEEQTQYNSGNDMFGFVYDDSTNTIKSNNQFQTNSADSVAYSYIELDLTNKTGTYDLSVTATLEGYYSSKGIIAIKEYPESLSSIWNDNSLWYSYVSGSSPDYSYPDADLFLNYPHNFGKIGPFTATQSLEAGKKYYLVMQYSSTYSNALNAGYTQADYEAYGISDQFTINAIRLVKTGTSEDIDIPSSMVGNAFDTDAKITYFDGEEYYGTMNTNFGEYYDSYIKLDLTDSTKDKMLEVNSNWYYYNFVTAYITSNNKGLSNGYINSHRNDMLMYKDDNNLIGSYAYINYGVYPGKYGGSSVKYLFEKGNVYYIHFNNQLGIVNRTNYKGENYDCENNYYCGAMLKGLKLVDVEEELINMGNFTVNVGTESYDSLPEDSNTIVQRSSDEPIINSGFLRYQYDSENKEFYVNNVPYYRGANFETEFDLTNETEPKTYYFSHTYTSGSYATYYTVDVPGTIKYNNNGNYSYPSNYTYVSDNTYFSLEPGHKYYFDHFYYNYSNGAPNNYDKIRIDYIPKDGATNVYTKAENIITFNEDVDEIQILKNIDLVDSIVVDRNKETILDLNGYKITSSLSTPIINNYGKLTIMDSDYENQTSENKTHYGILESSAGNVINNNQNAELTLKDCVINVNGAVNGIYNSGLLKLTHDTDTKVYVNPRNAIGVLNERTGIIENEYTNFEIIMNYNNQTELRYALYTDLRTDHINTGLYNKGYMNVGGLKISGKNGRGLYTDGENSVSVLRSANINVTLNKVDLDSGYRYSTYYSHNFYYYDITDTAIYAGYSSSITLTNGSVVNDRVYAYGGSLFISNTSRIGYVYTTSDDRGELYATNGAIITEAHLNGKSMFISGASVSDLLENTGKINTNSVSGFGIINNRDSGEIYSINTNATEVNNYDNGIVIMQQSNAKHAINKGQYMTLERTTINNTGTSYENAIENSSILNLDNYTNVIDANKYGIVMRPITTSRDRGFYNKNNEWKEYQEVTYNQVVLNIGGSQEESGGISNVNIKGKERGITGPCYETSGRKYIVNGQIPREGRIDTKMLKKADGTIEPIIQENYDQSVCAINMYSGYVASTDKPNNPGSALSLPISNTNSDSYTYWNKGLNVYPKSNAIANNKTTTVAQIGSQEFISLQDAIDSVTTNDPVTIDVLWYTDIDKAIIPEGRNITLNLVDAHNIFLYREDGAIENNGNLTVQGTGQIISYNKYAFVNNGNLTINNGTYKNGWNWKIYEDAILKNNGTATINGGVYNQLDVYNTKNLTINSGDFIGTMLYGEGNTSVTTVKGGYFNNSNAPETYYDYFVSANDVNTNGGWRHLFELNNGATGIIDGLNTDNDSRYETFRPIAHVNNSTFELKSGKIGMPTGDTPVPYISAENGSNIIVDDGTYENIHINIDSSNLTVNGGTLTSYKDLNGGNTMNLIYVHGSTPVINIKGGDLFSEENAIGVSDFKKNDDENELYSYKIFIGTKGDRDESNDIICSKTSPSIKGNQKAIAKYGTGSGSGYLGFYDGILKAPTIPPMDIDPDEVEEDFEIINGTEGSYHTQYLDQKDLVKNKTTGVVYKTFEKAFREATNGDVLVTLRDYTNTKTNSEIVIPQTSNFTLKIRHIITVNNESFIKNYGNATFVGMNGSLSGASCSDLDPDDECYTGSIVSNVTGSIVTNYGTLTINDLSVSGIKATNNANGSLFVNEENGTLNINGSDMVTVQHNIVNNMGILNIDKNPDGTSSCYIPTKFRTQFISGTQSTVCNRDYLIKNSGTANIKYLNMIPEDYCSVLSNSGTMTIEKSTFDQSTEIYNPNVSSFYDEVTPIYLSTDSITNITDSNFAYLPKEANFNYSEYTNTFKYTKEPYISCSKCNVTIDNSNFDTSFYGFIDSSGISAINISNSNIHNNSFGIEYSSKVNINLTNNTIETKDAVIDISKVAGSSWNWGYIQYHSPEYYNHYYNTHIDESTINIDGGTYISHSSIRQFGGYSESKDYTPIQISYNTTCGNTKTISHDSIKLRGTNAYSGYNCDTFIDSYTNAITSAGTINIDNATVKLLRNESFGMQYYRDYLYYYFYDTIDDSNRYSDPEYSYSRFGALAAFGNATINNSTIKVESEHVVQPAIYGYGDNTIVSVGTKDGIYDDALPNIVSNHSNPVISNINFYDGKLSTTSGYNDSFGSLVIKDIEVGYSVTGNNSSRYLTPNKVIKNITQNKEYNSIQTAFNEANNNDELQLLMSTYSIDGTVYSIDGKTLSLDLNNYQIDKEINIINSSNLTVTDAVDSADSKVIINSTNSTVNLVNGNGTLTASGTSVVNSTGKANYIITLNDSAAVNCTDVYNPNNTTSSTVGSITANDSSTVSLTGSRISTVRLYNHATISVSNSQTLDNHIEYLYNDSEDTITLNAGRYYSIYSGYYTPSINNVINLSNVYVSTLNIYYGSILTATNVDSSTIQIAGGTATLNNCTSSSNLAVNNTTNWNNTVSVNGGTYTNISIGGQSKDITGLTTVTIDGNPTINGQVYARQASVLNLNSGTFNGSITSFYSLSELPVSVINIGVKDGNVTNASPTITNGNYNSAALINGENKGIINFYDGTITGTRSYEAIKGLVNEVETDYKITVTDNGDNSETAALTPISSADPRVAMVLGINYNSLQTAINKSVMNCTQGSTCPKVTIYLNIELDADLTIADGYAVDIVSNGYSISTNNHTVPSTITLDGHPIGDPDNGGSIVNGIKGMLGLDTNTKNVLVYEMSDGSALSTENHYRLYSYTDGEYKIVDMEKGEEVARYNPGKGLTNMKPIKGRLYLTNLKPGSYKVTDDNNSEVTFTINEDGTLSGHVKEYIPKEEKIEATGEAKLIISIQTGIRRVNYMLMAISIIAVLSIMFVLKRKSQNNKNLV